MFFVVSYDIVDDKRRAKVAEVLKDYGMRVQYSVFECEFNEKMLRKMVKELLKYVKMKEDSIRVYRLCKGCQDNIKIYGVGASYRDDEGFIVI